jgi:hypothetical protein
VNENLELEFAGVLYRQLFLTRAKTDHRFLEFESFIVRHYGHEGTRHIQAIKDQHSAGPVIVTAPQNQNARPMRPFVHPPVKTTNRQITNLINTSKKGAPVAPSMPDQSGEGNPLSSLNEQKDVAVDGGDNLATSILKVNPADAKDLRPYAFGKKYGAEALCAFLRENGVNIEGAPSVTQLAQLAIQHIKAKE